MIGDGNHPFGDRLDSRGRRIGARSLNGIRHPLGLDPETNRIVEIPKRLTARKNLKITNEAWEKLSENAAHNGRELGAEVESLIAERIRVMALLLDGDGALPCNRAALAIGKMPSALQWHCAEGSGPPQLKARRGHRHSLADLIAWEAAQRANTVGTGDDGDGGA